MGRFPKRGGNGLTRSEVTHCKTCGNTEVEYLQALQDRIEELKIERDYTRHKNKKVTKIAAKNTVLVIGGGSSTYKYYDEIKRFKGKLIATEMIFNKMVGDGIIPDYVATLEKWVNPKYFTTENLKICLNKTKFICSSITREVVMLHLREHEYKPYRWITHDEPRMSNVGLFGVCYAKQVLEADKICILGFEHEGTGYEQIIYQEWVVDFWHFIERWDKNIIVNCSNGGKLYNDYTLDSTLKRLKIETN